MIDTSVFALTFLTFRCFFFAEVDSIFLFFPRVLAAVCGFDFFGYRFTLRTVSCHNVLIFWGLIKVKRSNSAAVVGTIRIWLSGYPWR